MPALMSRKTPEELKNCGIDSATYIVESKSDPILHDECVVSPFDMIQAFKKLDDAGIGYYITIILGLGGKDYRNLHALETARLLNRLHPNAFGRKQRWSGKTPHWKNDWKTGENASQDQLHFKSCSRKGFFWNL